MKFVETQSINKEGQLGILPISFSFFLFFVYECMHDHLRASA